MTDSVGAGAGHSRRLDPGRSALPAWRRVLTVVAHPDDESFALGALVDRWGRDGAEVSVLCLTRGEASTLGADSEDLSVLRDAELRAAAAELGVASTTLLSHPDGALAGVQPALEAAVERAVDSLDPEGILVFDPLDGVTGHPDHRAASQAAISVAGRHGMPVLGWALPLPVSDVLRAEHGAAFAGYRPDTLVEVRVDRERQLRAVACHASQAVPGSVLWRRLELLGDREFVRQLLP
ncbi:MAG: PIG-L deacetylase family protein [Ornithinibacter sp.]